MVRELKQIKKEKPLTVGVAKPVCKDIVEWAEYTGRFQSTERVDVKARVSGFLEEKFFKDGQIVKKAVSSSL